MTPQEIYNTVATHLFTQGEQATNSNGDCEYRAPGGLKCAAGCVLPDEFYRPAMEAQTTWALVHDKVFALPEWFVEDIDLIDSLQIVHDTPSNWESTESMRLALHVAARHHGPDATILDTLKFSDR